MLGFISGVIKAVHKNYLIVLTDSGMGYKIFVVPDLLMTSKVDEPIELYLYNYVREDQLTLYGFSSLAELDFFELLISVSGVGPKVAMAVLSVDDLPALKAGIAQGDPGVFLDISGVGKKTAERLIVELKERVMTEADESSETVSGSTASSGANEVMDVLLALGYSQTEAKRAVASIPKDLTEKEDQVREALRSLAKQ